MTPIPVQIDLYVKNRAEEIEGALPEIAESVIVDMVEKHSDEGVEQVNAELIKHGLSGTNCPNFSRGKISIVKAPMAIPRINSIKLMRQA